MTQPQTTAEWDAHIEVLRAKYDVKRTYEVYMQLDHAIKMRAGAALRERR